MTFSAFTTYDDYEAEVLLVAKGATCKQAAEEAGGSGYLSSWLIKRGVSVKAVRAVGPDRAALRALCDREPVRRPSASRALHKVKPKSKPKPEQALDRRSKKALEELRRGALPLTVARLVNLDPARVAELRAALQRGEYRNA
ncbi:hypothetical protein [Oceanicella sp. SM1341]|uniref:hypothetical protein n=1 Tax=Oceanicella sp. SM1341 TaxID=1548889 RepID=UPI000E48D9C4|nr:hypothetical protein [Oceanicella sp. SM1341]